ncbi:MAG: peptidoglycan DD-metalloendopeptidase family protein [Alphaproteobacteria bacterium]|nr:peptidoglycan DD-metalloendopeptidase family protein [Alphaproteobacteria bacterium]
MAAGMMQRVLRKSGAMLFLAVLCQGCTPPAKVVLYEERQQMSRGVRDVHPPVPRAKPRASVPAPVKRGAVETMALAPPGNGGGRVGERVQIAAHPAPHPGAPGAKPGAKPGATAARSYDKTADASSQYRRMPENGVHVVTPKETVYALSRLYGVPVRSLLVLNKLDPPYLLHTGQKVRIPAQRTHLVAQGETVYAISRRYDVSLAELVRLNEIGKPFTIVTGQTLLLPDEQRTAVATAAPEMEASGDADYAPDARQQQDEPPPPVKRVVLPPSTNIPRPSELSGDGFLWPLDGKVLSGFGPKGKGLQNDGINILAPKGTPIKSAQNGVVAYRGNELRGFGNLILIKHAKGYMTAYAHASEILVKRGAKVKRGQVIARVGNTGSVGDPQLHFEIRRGRKPVDPMRHLNRNRAASLESAPARPKG